MLNHLITRARLLFCLITILSLFVFLSAFPLHETNLCRKGTVERVAQTNINFHSFNGTIIIDTENRTCTFDLILTINNPTPQNISSFDYLVDGHLHSCDVETVEDEITLNRTIVALGSRENLNIVFSEPLQPGNNISISLEMLVDGYIESIQSSSGIIQQFIMSFTDIEIDSLNLVIALPITHSLTGDSPNFDIFPLPVFNYTDARYIYYQWPETEVNPSSPSILWVKYNVFSLIDPVTITVYNTTVLTKIDLASTVLLSSVTAVIGGVIASVILYYWFINEKEKLLSSVRPVSLNIPQKKILAKIKEKGGTTTQSALINELNFSKSKISGHLTELSDQGFIIKEKIGRENRISLIKDIVDQD